MTCCHCTLTRSTQKTASGIFLPTSATSTPLPEATVIAVGPGAPNKEGKVVPTVVKAGDRVLLPGWGGNSIKVGEEVRLVLPCPCRVIVLTRAFRLSAGVLLVQGLGDLGQDRGISKCAGSLSGALGYTLLCSIHGTKVHYHLHLTVC